CIAECIRVLDGERPVGVAMASEIPRELEQFCRAAECEGRYRSLPGLGGSRRRAGVVAGAEEMRKQQLGVDLRPAPQPVRHLPMKYALAIRRDPGEHRLSDPVVTDLQGARS